MVWEPTAARSGPGADTVCFVPVRHLVSSPSILEAELRCRQIMRAIRWTGNFWEKIRPYAGMECGVRWRGADQTCPGAVAAALNIPVLLSLLLSGTAAASAL